MNLIISAVISTVISFIVFIVHNKIVKKEITKTDSIKICLLGFVLGCLNYLILTSVNTDFAKKIGEFDTGESPF